MRPASSESRPSLRGLIAATYTPLDAQGRLRLEGIDPLTDHLVEQGIEGLYVCGSTGEGMSLSTAERKQIAERTVAAAAGRVPVIVQVGHNCVEEAAELAAHAAQAGADVVSATCPSYYPITSPDALVETMGRIAEAGGSLPFYYYHIPALTGSAIDIVEFLETAQSKIANLAGLKYTDTKLHEFQACQNVAGGSLDIVFGCDEMLLGALATGAKGAIGSTFNILAPLYREVIAAFEKSDFAAARRAQLQAVQIIRALQQYPFHAAMKQILSWQGFDCGPCRMPQRKLTDAERQSLQEVLSSRWPALGIQ